MTTNSVLPSAAYRIWLSVLYSFVGLFLTGSLASCEKDDVKPLPEVTEQWMLERLYFGRSMPNGEEVSEEAWDSFVAEVITPRFPDGLTLLDAQGQWQEEDGVIVRESTFILEVVHPESTSDDDKLKVIIEEYKKRFQQSSVLRVTQPAEVEF
ncbi:DUF3574 domain-containing protein [Rhodocytophaga rosea]|uniref:DUF3574 domain-containing protein n=1 Tax=Rhodocytophaga rosea TaxID=2704465 RepID=A0A6C0GLB7_9BACT|nr:DUF3574 domain-containing protein [Rhodocytophaga rosea]QHT68779.1 DUF3574 domain-containing protein [Rhodocytophaga rosea]